MIHGIKAYPYGPARMGRLDKDSITTYIQCYR